MIGIGISPDQSDPERGLIVCGRFGPPLESPKGGSRYSSGSVQSVAEGPPGSCRWR